MIVKNMKPKGLWNQFVNISSIPRCSKHEKAIGNYVQNEASKRKLESKTDKYGNIVVKIPAANSSNDPVILQSHMDMVCEGSESFDFNNQPIKLTYKHGMVAAENTTLGADNGIGMAAMLSMMDEKFSHPPLLLLFTVDEETGLNGAKNLSEEFVTGDRLINLDGEELGKIYIGCAGGIITTGTIAIDKIHASEKGYKVIISELKGGHSGVDIAGRANAIKLIFKILKTLDKKFNLKIASISAGDKINAIPRTAEVDILPLDSAIKQSIIDKIAKERTTDKKIKLSIKEIDIKSCYSKADSNKLIRLIDEIPNGVVEKLNGKVYTSSNLSSIKEGEKLIIKTFQRSYNDDDMSSLSDKIADLLSSSGFSTARDGEFPGWDPVSSELLTISMNEYEQMFGRKAEARQIHAGLECGVIKKRCNIKQLISFGPTIKNAHSPDEYVDVESVNKFYNYLKKLIERL